MNLSYWERKTWLEDIDHAIIGSGIVGLSCALALRKKYPKAKIVVFEKGSLPSGASTKNAGFACFGSVSEILEDLKTHTEAEVVQLVNDRVAGLELLRETLGDKNLDYQQHGGYELFSKNDPDLYEECLLKIPYINDLLKNVFLSKKDIFSIKNDVFGFKNIQNKLIFNEYEGQLDTGRMMLALLEKISKESILVINCAKIDAFEQKNSEILLKMSNSEDLSVASLFIATNGFAQQFVRDDVQPARAQVLITKPIAELKVRGTFHLDKGYYYFRNIDNRILLGGGRNLDFKTEKTSEAGLTALVQNRLEELLSHTILPDTAFEVDTRWSGIMGVGGQKKPILRELVPNVYCGVRLGGMGVAIGSSVGQQLANLHQK
ncbi:FAD-dependent oxidoreductase [Altibacter sp.]|uniref:NAD(P)/FAD-dependent oxidoreductase n=1 Tax=Altibacter sp. TaxID=2024823 RepID=UPI000C987C05|nr:FAD-dependent oxidoreductase [Altibacter sp.]MAP55709.1 FAD-dependent oxidoreductase [Altibacter sp.]|tara:strand:- start:45 stop:1172 length:1128 start_codon:yes stop_codon:yes gene_type:complete